MRARTELTSGESDTAYPSLPPGSRAARVVLAPRGREGAPSLRVRLTQRCRSPRQAAPLDWTGMPGAL